MTLEPIAVTGASGFIGRAITRAAAARGQHVVGVSRVPAARATTGKPDDRSALAAAFDGCATVIHAAGLAHVFSTSAADAGRFMRGNAEYPERVVEAAALAHVPHVVLLSSVAVYGGSVPGGSHEMSPCRPTDVYGKSKLAGEERAARAAARMGVALTILRLATVYGEEDPGNVARLIRAIDRGRFVWIGTGANRKSLVYRDDVAAAVLATSDGAGHGTRVFNVSAPPVTMRDVVDEIHRALGRRAPRIAIPLASARAAARIAGALGVRGPRGFIAKWTADDYYRAELFETTFGPMTYVPLETGIAREVAWYRARVPGA